MKRITPTILTALVATQMMPAQDTQNVSAGLTGAGSPLAIHGYDPVAYFTTGLPTRGSSKFMLVHDDAAYRFASEANKNAFERAPEQFAPQFGGFCAFGVTVEQKFDGDPRVFEIVDDKLYFNLNPDIQSMWRKDIPGNLEKARHNWKSLRTTIAHQAFADDEVNTNSSLTGASQPLAMHGYDPVGYFTVGLPTVGSAKFTATHGGAAYRFASEANKAAFEQDPARYTPQFGGFCAFGVSVGKKFDGDPRVFEVVDGKLYLNLNPDIQVMWRKDTRGNIEKASTQWAKVRATPAAKL